MGRKAEENLTANMQMFSLEGNVALINELRKVVVSAENGEFNRSQLIKKLEEAADKVSDAGFKEVGDTEVAWAITDFANGLCDDLGWKELPDRYDWSS